LTVHFGDGDDGAIAYNWISSNQIKSSQIKSLITHHSSLSTVERVAALGLDVGRKRIGVAGCDGTGLIATGLTTVYRKSFGQDVEQIRALVDDRQVTVLVVGLPYTMSGDLGSQAKQVQRFANRLGKALNLPVEYVDERLTSFQAEQMMLAEGRSPSRNKELIDRKAAALILQQWLEQRRQ
jgi:putative Holliday junction resolvase